MVLYVESPALAPLLPAFSRGLNDQVKLVTRTCCLIDDNMCKIVEYLAAVIPIMPELEPSAKAACEDISNLEARNMVKRVLKPRHPSSEATPQGGACAPLGMGVLCLVTRIILSIIVRTRPSPHALNQADSDKARVGRGPRMSPTAWLWVMRLLSSRAGFCRHGPRCNFHGAASSVWHWVHCAFLEHH